jgi:hypothetical protein
MGVKSNSSSSDFCFLSKSLDLTLSSDAFLKHDEKNVSDSDKTSMKPILKHEEEKSSETDKKSMKPILVCFKMGVKSNSSSSDFCFLSKSLDLTLSSDASRCFKIGLTSSLLAFLSVLSVLRRIALTDASGLRISIKNRNRLKKNYSLLPF